MTFSKNFPRTISEKISPIWKEVTLTDDEERKVEDLCRQENLRLLDMCLDDAKRLAIKHGINTDENGAHLAIALFEKLASHSVFWKEAKAKEKFESELQKQKPEN